MGLSADQCWLTAFKYSSSGVLAVGIPGMVAGVRARAGSSRVDQK